MIVVTIGCSFKWHARGENVTWTTSEFVRKQRLQLPNISITKCYKRLQKFVNVDFLDDRLFFYYSYAKISQFQKINYNTFIRYRIKQIFEKYEVYIIYLIVIQCKILIVKNSRDSFKVFLHVQIKDLPIIYIS